MVAATTCVLVWGFMVTMPASIQGTEDSEAGECCDYEDEQGLSPIQRAIKFRATSAYKFFSIIITRVLSVWIMASLIRPLSCVATMTNYDTITDTYSYENVISTATEVQCGGGGGWASLAAMVLLTYYLVTTASLGSDEADLLKNELNVAMQNDNMDATQRSSAELTSTVKFSPRYALEVRACQFLSIFAVMLGGPLNNINGNEQGGASYALIPSLLACFLMAIIPLLHKQPLCSFRALTPFRSAGAFACMWTTLVCLLRQRQSDASADSDSWTHIHLYAGWGVCLLIGSGVSMFVQRTVNTEWDTFLEETGYFKVLSDLSHTLQQLTLFEMSPYSHMIAGVTPDSGDTIHGSEEEYSRKSNKPKTMREKEALDRRDSLISRVMGTKSLPNLQILLAEIEYSIPVERLSSEFLMVSLNLSLSLKGLFLYTGGVLFLVE